MKITNETYYHIKIAQSPDEGWSVGNKLNWNKNRKNYFWELLNRIDIRMPFQNQLGTYRQANDIFNGMSASQKSEYAPSFKHFTDFALNKQSTMIRELVFENYRKLNYPSCPSRQSCVWFCTENSIAYWIKALQSPNFSIFKVKLNGEGHFGRDKDLYVDVFNISQYEAMAKEYWKPNQKIEEDTELIFNGEIEIIDRLM